MADTHRPMRVRGHMKAHRNVKIVHPYQTTNGIVYKVTFDVGRLTHIDCENENHLKRGSLVCLSDDNFESVILGTVAERQAEDLQRGEVFLSF